MAESVANAPRTLLVTGANGLVGSALLRRLALDPQDATEYTLRALVRRGSNLSLLAWLPEAHSEVELVEGDVTDAAAMARVCRGAHVVVHCAADMTFYPPDEAAMYRTNVRGAQCVVEAAWAAHVSHVVFVSSYEALGPGSFDETHRSEDTPPVPVYPYGKSKLQVQEFLAEFARVHPEFRYTTVLLPGVIGEHEVSTSFHEQLYWACNVGLFCVLPAPTSWCQYIHLDDAVAGLLCALRTAPRNESYLIVPDDALRYADVIRVTCEELGRAAPRVRVPVAWLRALVRVLQRPLAHLFPKQCLFHEHTVAQLTVSRHFSNAKARRELGFVPRWSMEAAVRAGVRARLRSGRLRRYAVAPLALGVLLLALLGALAAALWGRG